MSDKPKEQVESLIAKAEKAKTSIEAMQFSEAAVNCANALCALGEAKPTVK